MVATALLDQAVLDGLRAVGDEPFLASVIRAFFDTEASAQQVMSRALASFDPKELEHGAHRLKSICISVGARRAAELCMGLEVAGRSGRMEEAVDRLSELEAELTLVDVALRALIAR
jgi:HPt (histidine-containing phosphotransfer) domain-containing protein